MQSACVCRGLTSARVCVHSDARTETAQVFGNTERARERESTYLHVGALESDDRYALGMKDGESW